MRTVKTKKLCPLGHRFTFSKLVRVLELLERQLAHPYKQVRQAIGEVISIIFLNLWTPARNSEGIHTFDQNPSKHPKYFK